MLPLRILNVGGESLATFFRRIGLNTAVQKALSQIPFAYGWRTAVDNRVQDTKVFAKIMP